MSFTSWVRNLRSHARRVGRISNPSHRQTARATNRFRPHLEVLEDRLTPSTLTVNALADNITDTNVLTLRDAVMLVDNGGNPAALGQASMPSGWSSQIAGSFGSNDTIQFDPSLLAPTQQTITLSGSELLLGQSVSINGPGASQLAISGQNLSRVFEVAARATDTISGLTIEKGVDANYAGGISNRGTLTLSGCTVTGNRVTNNFSDGGGISNSGLLTISNFSIISGNSAGNRGGGIANFGAVLTVSNSCAIAGNTAFTGGGIYNSSYDDLTVSNSCTITGNLAVAGGGIYNYYGTLTVSSSSTIAGNTAGSGGGIFNTAGTVNIADSTVCGNFAEDFGDDIYGTATVTNSDVCVINLPSTTTAITSSTTQLVFGQAVTFTAMVSQNVALSGPQTGTVTFLLDGSTTLGIGTLDSFGQTTVTIAGLSVGTHTITAIYSGDANNAPSTSGVFTQTVLSAQQELAQIITQVTNMVTSGILDSANGNALITKLNNAITSLNSGNTITGDNQMNAFINQTNAFLKSGKLDSTDAQTLIDDIDLAIAAALVSPI
jgi:hypothetical protein